MNNNYKRDSLLELQKSHNELLSNYSKTLDAAEQLLQNITISKLIDNTIISTSEYEKVNDLVSALTNIVPYLVEITVLEGELDQLTSM